VRARDLLRVLTGRAAGDESRSPRGFGPSRQPDRLEQPARHSTPAIH